MVFFSHLNSIKADCVGILTSTLSSEGFVLQDVEENNPPGFQIVQMAWLTVPLIVQVFAHTLPQRILNQSSCAALLVPFLSSDV